jgi:NAD(P)-dependent dehydrogenase (short-subunit alcohol dehydrogenase family)
VRGLVADFASLADVARLAREVAGGAGAGAPIDVLVNNAGVGFGRDRQAREVSRDGHELRFAVNYLAPLVLTEELGARGMPARAVLNVASVGQEPLDFDDLMTAHHYDGVRAYRRSKLALVMQTFDLAERRPEIQAHALHPGTFLDTAMVRESGIAPHGPASRGAASIMAVLAEALDARPGTSGRYFDEDRPARADAQAYVATARRRLRDAVRPLLAPILGRPLPAPGSA